MYLKFPLVGLCCRPAIQLFSRLLLGLFVWAIVVGPAQGQFTITGVADKATPYVDTVAFTIGVEGGYTYGAFLNRERVPVGVPVTIVRPNFYELEVFATNVFSAAVSNRLVRFIVRAGERGGTEWGIPRHVPMPPIPSAAGELAGGKLRVLAPADFPEGFEIPVVAWLLNPTGATARANGSLVAAGHPSIVLKRGVGSGFLAANNPVGALNYTPSIQDVQTNKLINIEPAPAWTTVNGTLNGATVWSAGSRIRAISHLNVPAGASLTIEAGTIVLLNPGVNITNSGTITINGSVGQPVVFMPLSRSQPWGGFFMRSSSGVINATGTIFTGSGADPNGGPGHRPEQCLFLVDSTPRLSLTDSAAIYLAGQFGHAYNGGTFQLTRFLLQRATTGGEYTGASFTVNDSAFIEFPDDSSNFVDGDNDALYFVSGSHAFTNTLFGWTKDDGVDSGGSGYGPLTYQSCWFESTFHEGNSLSGYKNVLARDTVYMDCGQGIENGYDGPTNRMEHCLFLANEVGMRHGDNYPDIGNYNGRETATNSLALFNDRDVFGFNWHSGTGNGWTNATGQMTIVGNWLSAPNVYFPNNAIWNPSADAHRLTDFMTTIPSAAVGVGFAVRTNRFTLASLADGVPVRLSTFTTNVVTVDYAFRAAGSSPVGTGTLTFVPGQTLQRIYPANFDVSAQGSWSVLLTGSSGGELTGLNEVLFEGSIALPQVSLAVSGSVLPGYRIAEGTFVRLNGPTAEPVAVDYKVVGDGAQVAAGTLRLNPPLTAQRLLPESFNPFAYASVEISLSNPVGATLGATTSVTYTNPAVMISFGVTGNQVPLNLLETGLPVTLNTPAPGAVSVEFTIADSTSVLTNGVISLGAGQASTLLTAPSLNLAGLNLLQATLRHPSGVLLGTPNTLYLVRTASALPATNSTLIARGSVWRYRDAASAAPAGWQTLGFDDSGWPAGPAQLGFSNNEERDEATLIANNNQITSYFRRSFSVGNPADYAGLMFWLLRDDGGVVYLNGTEIFRTPNLPAPPAPILYSTVTSAPNGENTIDTGTTNRNALQGGQNVLAVEIHQQSATSSDVSFDFELIGIGAPPPPPAQNIYVGTFGDQRVIAWGADATFVLERASELLPTGTVWTPVGVGSPVFLNATGLQGFFRLRKP
jgi:hypothetical protein